jgi:hypothetical protein
MAGCAGEQIDWASSSGQPSCEPPSFSHSVALGLTQAAISLLAVASEPMTDDSSSPIPNQTELVLDPDGVEDLNEDKEVIPYNFEITAYGADYDVEGIVKRLKRKDILIPTFDPEMEQTESGIVGFQRRFVWRKTQCDRFIESLLLGLPVPGIFLVKETNGVLLVLDGQQRLRTLERFFDGTFNDKVFRLESVQDRFHGLTYKDLPDDDRRRLNDAIIHATVVRQDTPEDEQESVYLIFERLNTSGTTLQPQEVRAALYSGQFLVRHLQDSRTMSCWCDFLRSFITATNTSDR